MLFIHDEGSSPEVEVTGTGTHDETLHRRQTHRGVHALAVHHSCAASSAADVGGDNLLTLRIYAEELADTCGYIAVARSVEAVTADSVLLV